MGQFTDEIGGDHIHEFGATGPKSYGYLTSKGKADCKTKGIKNNHAVKQVLNCNSMMQQIQLELNNPKDRKCRLKTTILNHFVRNSKIKGIHLEDMVIKNFKVNWDKRVVDRTTGVTYPYGFVRF